jgi:hypothetical protein
MVRTISEENTSTLLGSSLGPLELRVVSTHLAGQSVRLNASKCTIGSGSRCTLRLQARRVEPVHCLILRGENGTVIRRWSPHTRLNGATFTDALLQAGDRLTIGPIELDVISTGQPATASRETLAATPADPSASAAVPGASSAEHARLLAELDEREIALMAREEALAEQLATLATQKSEWEKTQTELQAELATRRDEHRTLTHELNNLRQLKQDLPDLLEDRQQYEDRRNLIVSSETSLATAQAEFETERAAQEAVLAERRRELDAQAASLDEARQELAAARIELEQKQQALEDSFTEREGELNRRLTELESARTETEQASQEQARDLHQREQIWQESQAAWAAERAVWNTTCHETATEIQKQQAELERKRIKLAAEKEAFAIERAALEDAARAAAREILGSEDPTELEHKESSTEAAREVFEPVSSDSPSIASLFDAEEEEACDEEAFEAPAPAEETAPGSQGNENLHLHDESAEGEDEAEEREPSLAERLLGQHLTTESESKEVGDELEEAADTEAEDSSAAETEAPAFEEPVKASPAESSGLMERLRAMVDSEDDDPEQPTSQRPSSAARPSFEPATPLQASFTKPAPGGPAAHADDEEESIEDYMVKLLGRVRGDSAPLVPKPFVRPTVPQPEPVVEPEPEIAPQDQLKVATTPVEPFAMPQRQVPTELTSNLAAMRELANFSARDAIDTSVRNRWWQAAIGKFSVAGVALASAVILLIWTKDARSIQFIGAGIAVLIAIFWGLQGTIMLRNVRKANQLLAEMAKEPEEEAAKMREMLYAETEDLEFDPSKPIAVSADQPQSVGDPNDDVVEIGSTVDSDDAKIE